VQLTTKNKSLATVVISMLIIINDGNNYDNKTTATNPENHSSRWPLSQKRTHYSKQMQGYTTQNVYLTECYKSNINIC
jgi:hypothetical protein